MIGADHSGFQRLALRLAADIALGATGLIGGCAASSAYMGLDLAAPNVSAELRELARWAQAGDKQAQLELGIAFEEGRGVARDLKRARRLYAQAASNSGGPMWVYVPPVVPGQAGRVMQVETGIPRPGLMSAKERFKQLYSIGNGHL